MAQELKYDIWQQEFLKTEGDKILCCGRQVGKTEICAKDAGDWALLPENKNKNILMIAPTERQSRLLFSKTLDYLERKAQNLIKMGKDRPTKSKIMLKNGVNIWCLPTGLSGTGIRGMTVHRLYADEASQIPDEVWDAVTPMLLTTAGDLIMLSTPFGTQGEFYNVWINKDDAYKSFKRFSVTSEVVMKERQISDTWSEKVREKALAHLETEKKRKSKRAYSQEYLGEFVDDLFKYFPDELLKKCCILQKQSTLSPDQDYFLGVDIARLGEDQSTFSILLKKDDGMIHQTEQYITTKTLTTETLGTIIRLHKRYQFQKIGIDAGSGSLGVGIYDHLLEHEDTKRYVEAINNRARSLDKDSNQKARLLKEDLYDNLRALMEMGKIWLLDDEDVIESLRSIQYEYTDEGKIKIKGDYDHIAEGIIRAAILAKQKTINIWISSIKV